MSNRQFPTKEKCLSSFFFRILPSNDAKLNPNKGVYLVIQRLGVIFILSLNLVFFYINSLVGCGGFVLNPVNLPGIELREHDRQEREEHGGAAVQLQQCCCSSDFRLATGGGGHDHHPPSENRYLSAPKHLVDLRQVCKLEFICCGPVEQNQSAPSIRI